MGTSQTSSWAADIYIGKNPRNWGGIVKSFEWKSFINGGFVVKGKLIDHGFDLLDNVFTDDYFRTARQGQNPTIIKFRLRWKDGAETPMRTAVITDMDARGDGGYGGMFEFIAVDPISFYLNNGDCSGRAYKGQVGGDKGVIMQVLNDYIPDSIGGMSIKKKVSKTTEAETLHWMMRQDPKTFISSMLDWSSSLTPNKTNWIVANGEDENNLNISIEESYTPSLRDPSSVGDQSGPLYFTYGGNPKTYQPDILKWEMLHDSFIVVLNTKLVTSGMSAISGEYLDRITDWSPEEAVYVKDSNTENKVNPEFGQDRGYSKPRVETKGWTHIKSIPEHNAGDLGKKYSRYVDGRARQTYMDMLNMVMRIKVSVTGEPRLFDSTDLGRSKVVLKWVGIQDSETKFMDGNWLLYGWHHKLTNNWQTDVYLARLDFDAEAIG